MIAVAILVLALVLRLPWTAPVAADPARSFAAIFGEHAHCLAAASDAASGAGDSAPTTPGGHTEHDAAKCCQSHAATALVLPGCGAPIRILFATSADRLIGTDAAPIARSAGHRWARAPPFAAA